MLFTSDAQSFPMLDLAVPPPVAKGPWAAGSSSAGHLSRPLDVKASHTNGELLRQKPPQQQKQTGEQEWVTVAPKPKVQLAQRQLPHPFMRMHLHSLLNPAFCPLITRGLLREVGSPEMAMWKCTGRSGHRHRFLHTRQALQQARRRMKPKGQTRRHP